jgi:hypothetical protein
LDSIAIAISKAKQLLQTYTIYHKEEVSCEVDKEERKKKNFVFLIYSKYEALKAQSNSLDFDDLLFKAYQLLNQLPQLATNPSQLVVLDEVHNANLLQYEIGGLMSVGLSNVIVTGNPKISSYFLEKFIEDIAQQGLQPTALDADSDVTVSSTSIIESKTIAKNRQVIPVSSLLFTKKTGSFQWIIHSRDNESILLTTVLSQHSIMGYKENNMTVPYECLALNDVRKGDGNIIEIYNKQKSKSEPIKMVTIVTESETVRDEWFDDIISFRDDQTIDNILGVPDALYVIDDFMVPTFSGYQAHTPLVDNIDIHCKNHLQKIGKEITQLIRSNSEQAAKRYLSETNPKEASLVQDMLNQMQTNRANSIDLCNRQDVLQWKEIYSRIDIPQNEKIAKQNLIRHKIAIELHKEPPEPVKEPSPQPIESSLDKIEGIASPNQNEQNEEEKFEKMLSSLGDELEASVGPITPGTPIVSPKPIIEETISPSKTSTTINTDGNVERTTETTSTRETPDEYIVVHEKVTVTSPIDEHSMAQILNDFQARLYNFQKNSSNQPSGEEFSKLMTGIHEIQAQLQNLTNKTMSDTDPSLSDTASTNRTEQRIVYDDQSSGFDVQSEEEMIPSRHLNLASITPKKAAVRDKADQMADQIYQNVRSHIQKTPVQPKRFSTINSPFSLSSIEMTPTKLLHVHKMLKTGHVFWKHSSSGSSKKKQTHVYLSNNASSICFVKPDQQPGSSVREKIDVGHIASIQRGEQIKIRRQKIKSSLGSSLLGVRKEESKIDPDCMFAIITVDNRAIDLEAKTKEECALWADAWTMFLKDASLQFALPTDI